jgi:two-component system response regulator YesN
LNKLLIVDDEQIERDALKHVIEKHCGNVQIVAVAMNGKDAIEKAEMYKPDIIFMDIKMPGINGLEAAKQIKTALADCKIVFLSAFNYFDYAQKAIEVGAAHFILKPVSNDQVVDVIDRVTLLIETEKNNKQKGEQVAEKLNLALKYLENELLFSLVHGGMDKEQLEEYLKMLNITFYSGWAVVFHIQYFMFPSDASTSLKRNLMILRCMEKIKKILKSYFADCLIVSSDQSLYSLLISAEEPTYSKPDMLQVFDTVSKSLSKELSLGVGIGIGEAYRRIEETNAAFSHARVANSKATNDNPIVFYEDLKPNDKQMQVYPMDKEKQLYEKIIRCDEEAAILILDQIVDWIINASNSLDEIKLKVYDLTVVMIRTTIQELNGDRLRYYDSLHSAGNIEMIRFQIKGVLAEIIEELNLHRLDKTGALIEKVCEYIHANYMKEIKLEEMSNMINYSSYYFSKMFKYYQKQNFIDYVTNVRVEKAKELLRASQLSIKEISYLVGYADQNYFTRVFKRIENITPTDYRDKIMLGLGQ